MYVITTFDDKQHQVEDDFGRDLIEAWMNSDKSFPIDLGNQAISSSSIKTIEPQRLTEGDLPKPIPNPRVQRLSRGKICKAKFSIQKAINDFAYKQGKQWPKLISDTKWREATRKKLQASSQAWCDYKEGICACE